MRVQWLIPLEIVGESYTEVLGGVTDWCLREQKSTSNYYVEHQNVSSIKPDSLLIQLR